MIHASLALAAAAQRPNGVAWNPADKHANITLSNNNRNATHSSGAAWYGVRALTARSTGKWLVELIVVQPTGVNNHMIFGVGQAGASLATHLGAGATGWGYYSNNGVKINNDAGGTGVAYGSSWTTAGDRIWCAFDVDAGKVWWAKNGVWQASGDPASGANAGFTGLTGPLYPMLSLLDQGTDPIATINAGQEAFYAGTLPAGFSTQYY